jgi:hypothetical protein
LSIPQLDLEQFRRQIAGLMDPHARPTGAAELAGVKDMAVDLCLTVCEAWPAKGADRSSLWEWMGKSLKVAAEKTVGGDTDQFAQLVWDTFQIPPEVATYDSGQAFARWVESAATKDAAFRESLVRYCCSRTAIILPTAKRRWDERKAMHAAAKGGAQ